MGIVERYYAVLLRAYKDIGNNLQEYRLGKKIILQMIIKGINYITGSNGLVPTFFIFRAYFCISKFYFPTPIII